MSNVPEKLRTSILALALMIAGGTSYVLTNDAIQKEQENNKYLQAVAADTEVSDAIKIAMVMANYYESSNRHIGTPYVDKLGKGQPLTVCNGLTGSEVKANEYYSPERCYSLEKKRYLGYTPIAEKQLIYWSTYGPYTQATFYDFIHNKGEGNLASSTMRRKANIGDIQGACKENLRWNKGTVNKVPTVLPGLDIRAKSNTEICLL